MEVWEEIRSDAEKGAKRLVAEFWDRLFGASLVLCKDEHAAEDLVLRTFAQVIVKIDQYDDAQPFWNWLYAILLNYFRGDLRKMKAEVGEDADCCEHAAGTADETLAEDRLADLDAAVVRRAVSSLSPVLREVVMLRYFEDKTLQEMSQLMKVPVGTVKSRLHLARRSLKRSLGRAFSEKENSDELPGIQGND